MYSSVCYFSKLEHTARYKAKNPNGQNKPLHVTTCAHTNNTHTHTERQRVNTITGRDEISKITGNNSPECLQKNNVYIIYNFHFTLILTALIELK